jgi:hypothetical protein
MEGTRWKQSIHLNFRGAAGNCQFVIWREARRAAAARSVDIRPSRTAVLKSREDHPQISQIFADLNRKIS